jgi:Tol biopolymer transport system component
MAFSDNGTLVHFVGDSLGTALRTLSVVDRKGMATPLPFAAAAFFDPRVSPDGRQLVVRVDDESAEGNLWIYDLAGPLQPRKLTFGGLNISPLWTPDRRVIFLSLPDGGQPGIFSLPVEGGSAEPLTTTEPIQPLGDLFLSRDGNSLLFRNGTDGGDIWTVPMTGDRKPRPLIEGPSNQFQASFSRDGRWIAYGTAEGGSPRVYVQPFPPTGRKELVATADARSPLWSPDGKQLFYLENLPANLGRLTAVDIDTENGFRVVGKPQPIFDGVDRSAGPWPYAITDNGRFVVVLREDDATSSASAVEIRVTLNWFEDLKQRVPLD